MGEMDGRVCIVTGAAGSLGLAAAKRFIEAGARVMLVDLSQPGLIEAQAQLGDNSAWVVADVADAAQVRNYVEQTVSRWGKIDVLFSNAGNDGPITPVVDYSEDLFDSIIRTHVRGCFLGCKYVLPQMNDGGAIVITSSITGMIGIPGAVAYTAAKHALMGIARSVAKDVAKRRIRVNTVNPGPVANGFMREAESTMSDLIGRDAGEMFDQMIPMGRHAEPDEVADAVYFLASPRSAYLTGSAIMVDGGLTA